MAKSYAEKLRDPRWQKMRLKVLEAAGWKCSDCKDEDVPLEVHHRIYLPKREPWEYPLENFVACCGSCHENRGEIAHRSRLFFQLIEPRTANSILDELFEGVGANRSKYPRRALSALRSIAGGSK